MRFKLPAYLFLALLSFSGISTASQNSELHVVSARVLLDGKEVMAPNMQLLAGHTAYVSLSDSEKKPLYSLELEILPELQIGTINGVGLRAVLWEGPFAKGTQRIAATLMLSPRPTGVVGPISAVEEDESGGKVEIQIISHATRTVDTGSLAKDQKSCLNEQGEIAPPAGAATQSSGCCGGLCAPPSTNWYQCCNVTGCCVCGKCCIVP